DKSWSGGSSTTWGTAGNWVGGVLPGSTDNAVFNSTFGNQPVVGTNTTIGGIWMTGSIGQNFSISGATKTITLAGNTINGTPNLGILLDNANAFTLTISCKLALGAAQSWVNNSSNLFTVSGTVANGGFNLTIDGTGNTTISGVISGTGGLIKAGTGTLTLSAVDTYTGTTTINAGTLKVGIASALPATAVTVSGTGAGTTATLDLNGFSDTIGSLTLGGSTSTSGASITTGAGTLTLGGDVTYSATNNPQIGRAH